MKLKQLNDAINCFDKVIELDSKNVDALNKKGIAHCQLDEHTKALDSFDKIIGIDSTKYIDALNKKGYIYLDMKKYDKAIKCFEEVLKIIPIMQKHWITRAYTIVI